MAGENRNFDLDRLIKLSIIVGVSLISISIAYYLVLFIPQKERNRIELLKEEQPIKEQKEQEAQKKLDDCLERVEEAYSTYWADQCKANAEELGKSDYNAKCGLSYKQSDNITNSRQENRNGCYKRYPLK